MRGKMLLVSRNLSVWVQFARLSWGRGTWCGMRDRGYPVSHHPLQHRWLWQARSSYSHYSWRKPETNRKHEEITRLSSEISTKGKDRLVPSACLLQLRGDARWSATLHKGLQHGHPSWPDCLRAFTRGPVTHGYHSTPSQSTTHSATDFSNGFSRALDISNTDLATARQWISDIPNECLTLCARGTNCWIPPHWTVKRKMNSFWTKLLLCFHYPQLFFFWEKRVFLCQKEVSVQQTLTVPNVSGRERRIKPLC